MNQKIKAVLLDYGGVIAEEGFQNGLRAIAKEQGLDAAATLLVAKHAVYDSGFILGKGTAAEFWQQMRDGAGIQGSDDELTQRVLRGFILRPWMIDWVVKLNAQGIFTGILSDQSDWLDWLEQRDGFFHHFQRVFNSYYLGKGKREPSLFPQIAQTLDLSADEILFVDDMASNVQRARDAGWQAIRYENKRDFLDQAEQILLR
jgi:putative hydrolase of the HAD superfamily